MAKPTTTKHTRHRTATGHTARVLGVLAVGALALNGCSSTPEPAPTTSVQAADSTQQFLTAQGLDGLNTTQIIDRLDALPVSERSQSLIASVRPAGLVLMDDQQEVTLPMPEDKFYLSFAPYQQQTHDCHFHSLTTCLGEMQNSDVKVTVTDNKTGQKLVDESMQTFDNGFVGLWLPRGMEGTLTVEAQGKSGTTNISTVSDEDATCLTTLQLT
ncbi:hypothetical protein GcLGCM259_2561 [Glutamicibacter creatinolyticus]|uniref:CueP family metal-binding protein n=1 Tax=Glutamicibacter creatinolyticus TaxID=162496 RepID=A0A5B7WW85_9MICC|nr:CueP family metal-binding protein [Glutamicibacter creatinolyticus]QCY48268.1 hypothetical protein GcLGCM259_2561 [Glutamicibacter creatinolyticus]